MTSININNISSIPTTIKGINSASFNYTGKKMYSTSKISTITGVFVSNIIEAPTNFLSWDSIIWEGNSSNFNLGFFVRSSDTNINNSKWYGPFYNKNFDISFLKRKYFQFLTTLVLKDSTYPSLNKVSINFISSQNSAMFYTKLFDIGFSPKTILLTHNSSYSTDSIVRFAVSAQDTTDIKKYQFIEPNKMQDLINLSPLASGIKLLIEMSGTSTIPVVINEIAFSLGGEKATRVNKI